ncbi:hypothetical protein ACM6XV_001429 [Vibrio vulnificus]
MRFTLDERLFKNQNRCSLLSLLYNALRNLAYLDFDIDDSNVENWISNNNGDDWLLAYDTFVSDAASYNINNSVLVVDGLEVSDWSKDVPEITLSDACDLITNTTQIWVENSRNDGDFFRLFISPSSRKLLQTLINSGRVMFDGKGGIGEMKAVLNQSPTDLGHRNKRFIVYDSDAPEPNKIQPDAIAIKETCSQHKIVNHHWQRRAIENYLPVNYLLEQIHVNVRNKSSDAKKYQAFLSLSKEQRHHYHMKKGLGDSTCYNSSLYSDDATIKTLETEELYMGFSGQFANKFIDKLNHKDANRIRELISLDDHDNELREIEQRLFQYIRVPV